MNSMGEQTLCSGRGNHLVGRNVAAAAVAVAGGSDHTMPTI